MAPVSALITSTTNATIDSRREKSNATPPHMLGFSTGYAITPALRSEFVVPPVENFEITAAATAVMRLVDWGNAASDSMGRAGSRQAGTENVDVEVHLPEHARVTLDELVALDGCAVSEVLTRAIEEYWDRRLFEAGNAAYAELRQDAAAWDAYQAECAAWEGTLMDGLGRLARPIGE